MCTTYLVTELLLEFSEHDAIGYPRLVRLNPNIPWKTRGNGAICLKLGKGRGRRFFVGNLRGRDIFGYEAGENVPPTRDMVGRVGEIVEKNAMFSDKSTNPAFVVLAKKPSSSLYWKAVREVVSLSEVRKEIQSLGYSKGYKNERGLIGASSAVAWKPRDRTYELLAYRSKQRWGTKRELDENSIIQMDKRFVTTFNNYDYQNRRVAIAPESPCPVLYGIRGEKPEDLVMAMRTLRTEKSDRWVVFLTNQGTDEHLVRRRISELKPFTSAICKGEVVALPTQIRGGHVILRISDGKGEIDCTAYEPTKQFRHTVEKLRVGDKVVIYGSVRKSPRTINIEKLRVLSLISPIEKVSNPDCPLCGKKMKSAGAHAGYRCKQCGTHAGEDAAVFRERSIIPGFYEPPVSARRHLSKPLKRMEIC